MDQTPLQVVTVPTRNPFAPRTIEVEAPSGRKYTLRELSSFDGVRADQASKSQSDAIYYRVGLAIDVIDGERIVKREKQAQVDVLLEKISDQDMQILCRAYANKFAPAIQEDADVKNSDAPSD